MKLDAWCLKLLAITVVTGPLLVDLVEKPGQLHILLHLDLGILKNLNILIVSFKSSLF